MEDDLIYTLYICSKDGRGSFSGVTKSDGFILSQCEKFSNACEQAQSKTPDLIIIETEDIDQAKLTLLIKQLAQLDFKFRPAIFLAPKEIPGRSEYRLELMQSGVDDFLFSSYSREEVRAKYEVFRRNKDLEQNAISRTKKLDQAFEYLEKFKKELKTNKKVLFEERETLNNALKQVNQLTRDRKRLKQEKKDLKTNAVMNLDGWFEILSRLIEARIEKNRGHGLRVAHISEFIAKEFKFDEKKLEDLRKAAILHEVGLLLVPGEILDKQFDQLSEYEKDFFVQYPVKGADLLSKCPGLTGCAEIIQHLHENADGTGSPEGLKRKYIPLSSRILAGAEVFDSLKDKEGITNLESFLEKLEGYAGSRLDPNIVSWLERYAVLHMGSDAYRVKGLGVHQLEPGMTLGTAVFTNTGTKLFSVNTLLTQDAIDKIRKYNREYPVDETVYIRA